MHEQIETATQGKMEIFREEEAEKKLAGAFGLVYKADNMDKTFRKGDKLYLVRRRFASDGDIVVIRLEDPDCFYVCRAYGNQDGGFTLVDEKNPPMIMQDPDFVGAVIGYERIF